MDNLWEIFPSIEYYLEDHPQLLHQIPSQQPDGLLFFSQQNTHQDPTSNHNLNNNDSVESFKAAASCSNNKKKRKRREEVKIKQRGDDDDSCRKALHRDIEKRRRNQMADLYKSLRSLLPLEYIKGKRSASDHMQASVSYIKDLKKKVEGLHNQREKMKMMMKMKKTSSSSSSSSSNMENDEAKSAKWCWGDDVCVAVNKCKDGVEILMNTRGGGLAYPLLSKLLETLLRQGLNVVNCCYSHQHQCSLLRIQSQANEWSDVEVAALQQKLADILTKPH